MSRRVLPDPRVVQFWDGSALTSEWFAKNVEHSRGPAWDVYCPACGAEFETQESLHAHTKAELNA